MAMCLELQVREAYWVEGFPFTRPEGNVDTLHSLWFRVGALHRGGRRGQLIELRLTWVLVTDGEEIACPDNSKEK